MADMKTDQFVSSSEISEISNANKEKGCKCCHKLKQELNVTL
jgi:hypothetical protein